MALWQIFSLIAVIALILEMVVPTQFFFNFAVAGVFTALLSLFVNSWNALIIDFIILSLLSIWLIRPILLRHKEDKSKETGMDGKYIGQIVKAISPITKTSGVITIYEERWEARTLNDEEIPEGAEVRIVKNDSLVLYVERV